MLVTKNGFYVAVAALMPSLVVPIIARAQSPALDDENAEPAAIEENADSAVSADDADSAALEEGADSAAPEDGADSAAMESVVVVGTADGQSEVLDRRNAVGVVDTMNMGDIGVLPDLTMAESLSRLPGVSRMKTTEAEVESEYISVRGISPDRNFVSVDGIGMISLANEGAGSRAVDLGLLPREISSTVEVYKSFSPDLDGGAIGGVVNIVPRSAFDSEDGTFFIDTFLTYYPNNDVDGSRNIGKYDDDTLGGGLTTTMTQTFGSNDQFGVVFSANYRQWAFDETKRNPNDRVFYKADGTPSALPGEPANGSPDDPEWNGLTPPPRYIRSMDFTNYIENYGGALRLEYAPGNAWYHSLMLYDYQQVEYQNENQFFLVAPRAVRDQTNTTGTLNVSSARTRYIYEEYHNASSGAIFKSTRDFGGRSNLTFRAGLLNTDYAKTLYSSYFYNDDDSGNPARDLHYDLSGDSVSFTLADPTVYLDPDDYVVTDVHDNDFDADGDAYEVRVDYAFNSDMDSRGFGFKTGVGVRGFDFHRDDTITYYEPQGGLSESGYIPDYIPFMWNYPVLWSDHERFRSTTFASPQVDERKTLDESTARDYGYEETVRYAYAAATFASDRTRVTAGLRLDSVDFTAGAPLRLGDQAQPAWVHNDGDYDHVLPSAIVRHNLSDSLVLKAGISRSLGRPAPGDIARQETRDDANLSISRGNPLLKPRVSDNFDVALEYYFGADDNAGMVSLSAFHKEIEDDIYMLRSETVIDDLVYEVIQPMNAESSEMRGLEVNFLHNRIPGLPGFLRDKVGVSANVTRTWGEMNYLQEDEVRHIDWLTDQREWLGNLSAFYQFGTDGEFRLAYSYMDGYYKTVGSQPWASHGNEPYDSLDASVTFRVGDNWLLQAQATNLLDESVYLAYGEDMEYRRGELHPQQSFMLHFIYRP